MDTRLILDPPLPGDWNMAVDQALLDSADTDTRTLRFYTWQRPAVSLGYFQPWRARAEHLSSRSLPHVRRPTGGGALVHDNELTYCIAAPVADRFRRIECVVTDVHEALTEVLAAWGLHPELAPRTAGQAAEPFLCFQRRSRHDVILSGAKIAGSAQRRYRSAAMVHGSVLIAKSEWAPELPGIREISGVQIAAAELAERWSRAIAERFGWRLHRASLTAADRAAARRWQVTRYMNQTWNERR